MTILTDSEMLEALAFCQQLWPDATTKTDCPFGSFYWVVWVEITEAFCVEIVGKTNGSGAESCASCGRDMGTVVARSSRSPGVGWKEAVMEVAQQLVVLADQIKPRLPVE